MKVAADHVPLEEFISTLLLHDFGLIVAFPSLRYLSFGLVAAGIEFLGACTDRYPFDQRGRSEKRFMRGIERFLKPIDGRYSKYNTPSSPYYLYAELRHSVVQAVLSRSQVSFMTREDAAKDGTAHLAIDPKDHRLVLVAEEFYAHFALACEALKAQLPTLALSVPKLKGQGEP
jgi:hypothetical protein